MPFSFFKIVTILDTRWGLISVFKRITMFNQKNLFLSFLSLLSIAQLSGARRSSRPRKKKLQFSSSWIKTEPPLPHHSVLKKKEGHVNPTQESITPKIENKPRIIPRKKRILIFSSHGGGGHTAVSNGLNAYLFDDYEIKVANIFTDVLGSMDTLGALSFGAMGGEDLYNFCLRARLLGMAGSIGQMGNSYFTWRQDQAEKLIMDYFSLAKPDLIISVVPFVNAALLSVAQKLDIPFLVVTNDLDTSNYISGINNPTFSKFRYTLSFDDAELRKKVSTAGIKASQISVTGFPLRPEFFKAKDRVALKKEFNVPAGKPVVMIFMGGAGSLASYRYVRILARLGISLHMVVVLGRNERLRRNINKIMLPEGVTMTLLGFTPRIADLMAISDVLITKPGPGSVCEALESEVPMILDATTGTIWWEELNISFMVKHGFGVRLEVVQDLEKILPRYIKKDGYNLSIKKKMREFKRERFDKSIKPLVEQMLAL